MSIHRFSCLVAALALGVAVFTPASAQYRGDGRGGGYQRGYPAQQWHGGGGGWNGGGQGYYGGGYYGGRGYYNYPGAIAGGALLGLGLGAVLGGIYAAPPVAYAPPPYYYYAPPTYYAAPYQYSYPPPVYYGY